MNREYYNVLDSLGKIIFLECRKCNRTITIKDVTKNGCIFCDVENTKNKNRGVK